MTQIPCSTAHRPMASISSRGYTAPVGLEGETNTSALVASVRAASSCSTEARKPAAAVVGTGTVTAPANAIGSG